MLTSRNSSLIPGNTLHDISSRLLFTRSPSGAVQFKRRKFPPPRFCHCSQHKTRENKLYYSASSPASRRRSPRAVLFFFFFFFFDEHFAPCCLFELPPRTYLRRDHLRLFFDYRPTIFLLFFVFVRHCSATTHSVVGWQRRVYSSSPSVRVLKYAFRAALWSISKEYTKSANVAADRHLPPI